MKWWRLAFVLLACSTAAPAFAAREKPPTGKEIAEAAARTRFDKERSAKAEKGGKAIVITPAAPSEVRAEADLENGAVIGHIDTAFPGDETKLPPGRYNLFLVKVGGRWRVYAESGGKIVAEAKRVTVKEQKLEKEGPLQKPTFEERGWCVSINHTFKIKKLVIKVALTACW